VRDGTRRPSARLWAAAAAAAAVGVLPTALTPFLPGADAYAATARSDADATAYVPVVDGQAMTSAPATQLTAVQTGPQVLPLGTLHPADLLVIAPTTLPTAVLAAISRLPGVSAVNLADAARIKVNGSYVATLGVDPSTFRAFTAMPTADSTLLWQNVADGAIAVSYLMGQQENLPLGGTVAVTGTQTEQLRVGGYGTVGITGVDAVVSDAVARSLGLPAGNAVLISAPNARLSVLIQQVQHVLPKGAAVAPLVAQPPERGLSVSAGSAGAFSITQSSGAGLTVPQTTAFLTAALSRVGMPYVWGGSGPNVFDCSGLVQWSMRQAGIVMPRVAASQAQTGPRIPVADLQPGDLLFYHTDPTAPTYISHVAIYTGRGLMLQAPQPGQDVQVVPAFFGSGFAGAVRVYPSVAAAVAGNIAG
jgi:cell wall-associated NlpC family hydrolase